MDLKIPILNEVIKRPGEKQAMHRLSPVFLANVTAEDELAERAKTRLLERIRERLNSDGRSWSHQDLIRLAANPELRSVRLKLELEMRRRIARVQVLVLVLKMFDREVAFLPKIPALWFDLNQNQPLEQRTRHVLQAHFRELEKESPDDPTSRPEYFATDHECWISHLTVSVREDPVSQSEIEATLLALFSNETVDGATELGRVGRCLDHLYPSELNRATYRESELEEIESILLQKTRTGIVLIGPSGAGKTTIVHELVYRHVERHSTRKRKSRNFWWLSPARLISGMMYVGQWENRLLAILKEAKKRGHWLYFDDLLSMFRAGQSRDSKLCVADLVRNALVAREVRLIAEMSPEAWHVLQTKHQSFADLWHPVRIWPMSADQARSIVIQSMQELEIRQRCQFSPQVIAQIIDMEQSHGQTTALPGRIVGPLKALAIRHSQSFVTPQNVLDYYQARTGLQRSMLTNESAFSEEDFYQQLRRQVVGQDEALRILAQIVSTARARLNENGRPLGTLLFLGPTGVGKTECAKAVCQALFQSRDYLLRFDLNQFKTAYAAATLVGTPEQPNGLLTSAIQQRPFCVLLLDEIEKAHRDVHDLLLQVLGEGRLTDAHGHTTDFSKCLIIMTSNLGAQGQSRRIGFNAAERASQYLKAAQSFFRPEFFNRIDDVVPFAELNQVEVEQIAGQMLAAMIGREGLARRQCVLHVEPTAMEAIVQWGYHPELGARAMKRALEDHLARPVALQLSALPIDEPTLVRVYPSKSARIASIDHGSPSSVSSTEDVVRLQVEARVFEQVARVRDSAETWDPTSVPAAAQLFLDRVKAEHESPTSGGPWSVSNMTPEMIRYFAINEQIHRIEKQIQTLLDLLSQKPKPEISFSGGFQVRRKIISETSNFNPHRFGFNERRFFHDILAADDLNDYLTGHSGPESAGQTDRLAHELVNECVLLETMVTSDSRRHAILYGRYFNDGSHQHSPDRTGQLYRVSDRLVDLAQSFGIDVLHAETDQQPARIAILLRGVCIQGFVDWMSGSYLNIEPTGGVGLIQMIQVPRDRLPSADVLNSLSHSELLAWCQEFERSCQTNSQLEVDPFSITPVVQIVHRRKTRLDLRSQMTFPFAAFGSEWREACLRGLPLPSELASLQS
ncbi:MAG: ATP-dependent Clp protease ATP-binding subunit [Planctomycetaceae bacterium]|nr:ATP-dependent Clp protease ATP-binding subunit [Planctomycetaceae bacterium]